MKYAFLRRGRLIAGLLAAASWICGFCPSASAIVPWTLAINTNFVVNVTNYGGAPNGTADCAAAISNAISAAAAGGTTNGLRGGTVEIPAGVYLSGPLILKSYVNLQLDAGAVLRMLPFGKYPVICRT